MNTHTDDFSEDKVVFANEWMRSGYTIQANCLSQSSVVPGAVLKTYQLICTFAYGNKETCFPSRAKLADILNVSEGTVDNHIKELKELKLLSCQRRGFAKSNLYTILNLPRELLDAANEALTRKIGTRSPLPQKIGSSESQKTTTEELKEEELKEENYTSYKQTQVCEKPTVKAYAQGSMKNAPKEELRTLYANSTKDAFCLVSGLAEKPTIEKKDESLALIDLKTDAKLASRLNKYTKTPEEDRKWTDLEIDFLKMWEIILPEIKGTRFPSYTASYKKEDGTVERIGERFFAQLKLLTKKHGYKFMKGYIEWSMINWNNLRNKRQWMSSVPNILQIVNSFNTFSTFYQTGTIEGYVPQVRVDTGAKQAEQPREWVAPVEQSNAVTRFLFDD